MGNKTSPNSNPEFVTTLETSQTIVKTNEPAPWSYSLPATTDPDGDAVTVTVTIPASASSFMTFDATEKKLDIAELQDELNSVIPIGTYVVDVVLDDGNGGSASYQITLEIQEAPNQNPEFSTTLQTSHTIVKTNSPASWSYTLPATTDLDTNDVVTVTVTIPASVQSFLTFDDNNNELRIDNLEEELNIAIPLGSHVVNIDLNDENGGSASYQITLDIQNAPKSDQEQAATLQTILVSIVEPEPEEENKEEETEKEVKVATVAFFRKAFDPSLLKTLDSIFSPEVVVVEAEIEKPQPIVPAITSVSAAGEMIIEFSPPEAIVPDSWSELWEQAQNLDLTEPQKQYIDSIISQIFQVVFIKNSDEEEQSFFNQSIVQFTPSGITVQMDFSDPLLISQGDEPD